MGAGVTGIGMDLLNLGSVDLEMRLLNNNNFGCWTSTNAVVIHSDRQWHHVVFGVTAADLTYFGPVGSPNDQYNISTALQHVTGLVLRHQSGLPLDGSQYTPIESDLGIDNIQAVPEPIAMSLIALAACGFYCRRERSRS
jgi:hypothetical protein